jgi:hypothetical protein
MTLRQIRKARFDALCYSKNRLFDIAGKETDWWADDQERVLGVTILDLNDQDWSIVILGRDEAGMFRAIDVAVSFASQDEARAEMHRRISEFVGAGAAEFPKHDVDRKKLEILRPVVRAEKIHENLRILLDDLGHSPAREIIKELAYAFVDIDGNYVKDFQTTGFNSRLWELYLFAFLYEQRFSLFREFERPDFCVEKDGCPIVIEAVTVNATSGDSVPQPTTDSEIAMLRQDYMPIKFGSALYSKLTKK